MVKPLRWGATAALLAVTVALTGCGGNDAAAGRARAQRARAQAVSAAQALARRFLSRGLGPVSGPGGSRSAKGSFLACPPAMGTGMYYSTGFAAARAGEAVGRGSGYRQQVASVLTGAGWRLAPTSTPQHEEPFGYTMTKGRLSGGALASLRSGGVVETLIYLNSACFDPGAAAASIKRKTGTFPLPGASG